MSTKKYTRTEMAEWIRDKYPISCIAANWSLINDGFLDVSDQIEEFFRYECSPLCGCGTPDTVEEKVILPILIACDRDMRAENYENRWWGNIGAESLYDSPLWEFVAYTLDHFGFIEHGSSINGAWTTELGKMYLQFIKERMEEE